MTMLSVKNRTEKVNPTSVFYVQWCMSILNLQRLGALRALVFFAIVQPMMIFRFYNFCVVAVAAGRQEEKEQQSV